MANGLKIDDEFRSLIPALSDDERRGLEESIIAEGCREKGVAWNDIIIDGHNRYEICQKQGVAFDCVAKEFPDRDAAKIWIIRNQFGRRNLSTMQRTQLVIKLEPLLAAQAKENQKLSLGRGLPKSANLKIDPLNTREELAKLAGVSHDTIDKVKKIEASPVKELSRMTRDGAVSINAAAKVAAMPEAEQRRVVEAGPEAVKDAAKVPDAAIPDDDKPKARGKAIDIAQKAIAVLLTIPPKDQLREEALALVVRWCRHNR